jgi:hypothetical protein
VVACRTVVFGTRRVGLGAAGWCEDTVGAIEIGGEP